MKVSVYLKKCSPSTSNVCFRVREKNVDIKTVSPLIVQDKYWDADSLSYRRTTAIPAAEQKRLPRQIASIVERAERTFSDKADGKWMKQVIKDALHPALAFEREHPNLLDRLNEYIEKYDGSEGGKKHINAFMLKMSRYHDYNREILGDSDFTLFVETLTLEQMNDFRDYIINEYMLSREYPDFYASRSASPSHKPRPLSNTTVINIMNMFCIFMNWCRKMKYSDNNVHEEYGCKLPTYGDPFYLTSKERNILYDADLDDSPKLALIRDIFVFQCYVGCRVGDLFRLTRDNIIDGFLEYVPQKTKKCRAKTVRVPLHRKALNILERYDPNTDSLFPFLPVQTYNEGIRKLLKHCGIDRMVTILDTHGYGTVQKPLYEVATSHTARKTFIGNLYKKVPDPNLIAAMSGHVDNSSAFARYRTIDDDTKRRLVEMIN
ncbi:MAG: site-specific integrase [Clostridia bacterium]|nr:site-specific integrase [Clostridia bacterium]